MIKRDFLVGVMLAAATMGLNGFEAQALLAEESTATGASTEMQIKPGEQTENFFSIPQPAEGRPEKLPYLLYTPSDYVAGQGAPMLLFLHGLGESGDGNFKQIAVHGPPKRVAKEGKEFPFVIVSPQSPHPGKERELVVASWKVDELMALLDHVEEHLTIDTSRVYVSGLSMGGFGTWRLAATHPERFAAAVPVCGGGKTEWADELAKLPIWAFHGGKDTVVETRESEEMVAAIQRAGGDVKLTIYPEAGHDSWTATYANPEVYAWLMRHQLQQ
ncbi:carboxylesterase family protein [Rhodopirellula bahusiensis]|uniref:Hydrolase n=1 Tax=Rhodopirellula bahusiensis TaxID=2014065 RepID=A0A2G1WAY8_9BACT|nr:prolyl oligopeptidase family serine peptidase [Rhodopirellula bahusiensis]PHQ36204.1 hydrolase [Rhodopirellula bahusiensis]